MRPKAKLLLVILGGAIALALPWAPFMPYSVVGRINQAAILTLVAASLVLLTGWAGQISLGHAALVGVGAYTTGWMTAGLGIPFPLSVPAGAIAAGAIAALLGAVAVRVRGLYLAVATLIFSWMADAFIFRLKWFTQHATIGAQKAGRGGEIPAFDFSDRRYLYYLVWAFALAGLYAAANLRDSKTGRALFAVRGSEMAAASLGISVVRYKLLAFVISGTMAGVAGALVINASLSVTPSQFGFNVSLLYLSVLVVAGISTLPGAVGAAIIFASLEELFFRVKVFEGYLEVASAALLAIVLHAAPGGIGAAQSAAKRLAFKALPFLVPRGKDTPGDKDAIPVPTASRFKALALKVFLAGMPQPTPNGYKTNRKTRRLERLKEVSPKPPSSFRRIFLTKKFKSLKKLSAKQVKQAAIAASPNGATGQVAPSKDQPPLIKADHLTVRFGGLTAVNDVSLEVPKGKIIGLIGPNGAGKTTCFNAISGLVIPTEGKVSLYGKDVTNLPVHERAAKGLARTFQVIQLFAQLTVFDNLLVAGHTQDPTGVLSHLVATNRSMRAEQKNRSRVKEVIEFLDLKEVADRPVAGLPFGILRMVEIARALVSGAPAVMLDETASGLDDTETDRLIEILYRIKQQGISMLLIEHDVRMVTTVSDYMYVLDQGRLIAQGTPETIKRDPAVIAAYLGEPVKQAVG